MQNWIRRYRICRLAGRGRLHAFLHACLVNQADHQKAWDEAIREVLGEERCCAEWGHPRHDIIVLQQHRAAVEQPVWANCCEQPNPWRFSNHFWGCANCGKARDYWGNDHQMRVPPTSGDPMAGGSRERVTRARAITPEGDRS